MVGWSKSKLWPLSSSCWYIKDLKFVIFYCLSPFYVILCQWYYFIVFLFIFLQYLYVRITAVAYLGRYWVWFASRHVSCYAAIYLSITTLWNNRWLFAHFRSQSLFKSLAVTSYFLIISFVFNVFFDLKIFVYPLCFLWILLVFYDAYQTEETT